MKINVSKFNDLLLYSNKNVEKLARNLVNESSNAVLMSMFEDKCHIADHTTGQIFEADYSFDGKTFTFENFEKVELVKDEHDSLKEAIMDYFNDENVNLAESYEKFAGQDSDIIEKTLTEALASKNVADLIDYSELEGINEEVEDLKDTELYKVYSERLETHPTNSIKMFNWKDPVKVSLIDEDKRIVMNKSIKTKAKSLKSNPDFKKDLTEAAKDYLDGDISLLEALVNNYTELLALDTVALKESVGFAVLGNTSLTKSRSKITKAIEAIISEDDVYNEKREMLLSEEDETEDTGVETDEKDVETLKKALTTAKRKVSDEKLIDKIEDLLNAIEASSSSGETDVGAVKEAIEILKM